uniref:KH domain-containing protein n=1 Tax=Strongyloides papillosus TaxID=174720 RepID=A0A0N5C9C1_STREA
MHSTMASLLSQNQALDNDQQFKKALEPLQELVRVAEKNISDLSEIKEHSTMLLKHLSKRIQGKSNKEVFLDFVDRNSPAKMKSSLYGPHNSNYSIEAARNAMTPIHIPQLPPLSQNQLINSLNIINNSCSRTNKLFNIDDVNNNNYHPNDLSRISSHDGLMKTPENERNLRRMLSNQNFPGFQETPKGRMSSNPLNIGPENPLTRYNSSDLHSPSHVSNVTSPLSGSRPGYVTFTAPKSFSYNNNSPPQNMFSNNEKNDRKMFVVSIKAMLKEVPGISIIGRLIGPKGMNIKTLEEETKCQICIRGKGSSKDPEKEKKLSRHPYGAHFSEPLHVVIQTSDKDYKTANDRLFDAVNKINSTLDFTNTEKYLTVMENISCRQIDCSPVHCGY